MPRLPSLPRAICDLRPRRMPPGQPELELVVAEATLKMKWFKTKNPTEPLDGLFASSVAKRLVRVLETLHRLPFSNIHNS